MNTPLKTVSKIVLTLYLLTLLWLVLFKFSYDLSGVLFDYQSRTLNLVPFAGFANNTREMVDNFMVFIPFGLLLGVVFKQTSFWQKFAVIFSFSLATEVIQYLLAIGMTDITDLITNTLGGLLGLTVYKLASTYIDDKKIDWFIVVVGAALLAMLMWFRFFVLQVRY